jgi:hypothetical protein
LASITILRQREPQGVAELFLQEHVWNAAGERQNVLERSLALDAWLAMWNVCFLKHAGGAESEHIFI